jgi:hypothetical protein
MGVTLFLLLRALSASTPAQPRPGGRSHRYRDVDVCDPAADEVGQSFAQLTAPLFKK